MPTLYSLRMQCQYLLKTIFRSSLSSLLSQPGVTDRPAAMPEDNGIDHQPIIPRNGSLETNRNKDQRWIANCVSKKKEILIVIPLLVGICLGSCVTYFAVAKGRR